MLKSGRSTLAREWKTMLVALIGGTILSSNNKAAKKIANQLVKTSAVLMCLGDAGTAYELHVKTKMVALK